MNLLLKVELNMCTMPHKKTARDLSRQRAVNQVCYVRN